MSESYSTNAGSLDPQAGFTPTPSVSQAAHDLRVAAEGKIKDLASQAGMLTEKARESASQFRDITTEKAAHFREIAQEQWTDTRARAREVHSSAEEYVRQNPTKCVLGALGVGFLIGLITRR